MEAKGAGRAERIVACGIGTDASNDGLTLGWFDSGGPEIESKSNELSNLGAPEKNQSRSMLRNPLFSTPI